MVPVGTVVVVQETTGDLFDAFDEDPSAILVVTTNGCVSSGKLVMGAGVARTAKERFPDLPDLLGAHVVSEGNVPLLVRHLRVLSWPTKPGPHAIDGRTHPGWMCMTRVRDRRCRDTVARLTAASALRVLELVEDSGATSVLMPRPGCGLGGLDWARVGPWLHERFDDRFTVVERSP